MSTKLRGNHTSLIPLADNIIEIVLQEGKKRKQDITYSPGVITQKNIKVKQLSVIVATEKNSLIVQVVMKGSKQFLRIYDLSVLDFQKYIGDFCKEKNVLIKVRSTA